MTEVSGPMEDKEPSLKWPVPFNVSMDKLDVIVKGFFQGQADSKPMTLQELSRSTGVYRTTAKANANFLEAVKILKAGGEEDAYLFESKGADYARALSDKNAAEASSILKELLVESPLNELVNFAELQKSSGKLDYDALFTHIKVTARLKDNPKFPHGVSPPYSTGIRTLIDLLVRANIVPQDIIATRKEVAKTTSRTSRMLKLEPKPKVDVASQQPSTPAKTIVKQEIQGQLSNFPITITISVEAKDPESIKELINLLRELKNQVTPP
jgi:hypothetical protein